MQRTLIDLLHIESTKMGGRILHISILSSDGGLCKALGCQEQHHCRHIAPNTAMTSTATTMETWEDTSDYYLQSLVDTQEVKGRYSDMTISDPQELSRFFKVRECPMIGWRAVSTLKGSNFNCICHSKRGDDVSPNLMPLSP
jgi:hypothetical protein